MEAETTESLDIQGWKVPDSKDPILLWLGKDKLCLGLFNLDFFFLFPWIYVYIGLEFLGGCCSVTMSHFLQPHGLQHIRLPCSSLSPWVCSNSRSLSRWLHPAISFSVTPFFSCPQFSPASGFFPMSLSLGIKWPKYWSFSFRSVLSMNIQGWFPLGLTALISLLSKGLSRVFSSTQFESINSSLLSFFYGPTLTSTHDYWKHHSFDYMDKVMAKWCLCFLICCLGLS